MSISKQRSSAAEDTIVLAQPHPEILKLISEVGMTMNMETSEIDSKEQLVILQTMSSQLSGMLIGTISTASLIVQVRDDGKVIDLKSKVGGNFGKGENDAALKLIADFKTNLGARLALR